MSTPISSAGGRIVICPVDRSKDSADPSLEKAARIRRDADLRLSMSERLAKLHELAKQMTYIRDDARRL